MENDGGVDDKEALQKFKTWYVYVNKREELIKGGYLAEVFSYDREKVLLETVGANIVEEENDHDDIGQR